MNGQNSGINYIFSPTFSNYIQKNNHPIKEIIENVSEGFFLPQGLKDIDGNVCAEETNVLIVMSINDEFSSIYYNCENIHYIHVYADYTSYIDYCLAGKKNPCYTYSELMDNNYWCSGVYVDNNSTFFYPTPKYDNDYTFIKPKTSVDSANDDSSFDLFVTAAASSDDDDNSISIFPIDGKLAGGNHRFETTPNNEISIIIALKKSDSSLDNVDLLSCEVKKGTEFSIEKHQNSQLVFEFIDNKKQPIKRYFSIFCSPEENSDIIAKETWAIDDLFINKEMNGFILLSLEPDDITMEGDIFYD